jgi:aspartate/methionine/tyrosine aminotransferase
LASEAGSKKRVLYLNAPNNPTGYAPSKQEADQIREVLQEIAQDGTPTLVISDEAYFGFFFDDNTIDRHLVSYMAGLPENIIPVLVSGPTKELCVWGVRAGFITFVDLGKEDLEVMEAKISGTMRAYNSFGSALIQSFITKMMEASDFPQEESRVRAKLRERGLAAHQEAFKPEYSRSWTPYPFNSGYFCLVRLPDGLDANTVRLRLLSDEGVGTIASGKNNIRVAFSSTPTSQIPEVFASIDRVVQAMLKE